MKAQRVKDYEQYVSVLRLSKTMQQHMALFLAKLGGTTTARGIEHLCIEEKGWFEQQYSNDNTRAAYMTKYRKAIALMTADRPFPTSVLYEQETQDGPVRQHLALKWMNYSSEFHSARQALTEAKTKAQRRQRVAFEPQPVIDAAVTALSSKSTWEVAAAIILLTGRRPTEILKSAEFTQTGSYQLEFSGQLKSRSDRAIAYPIYSLVRTHLLIDAFTRFRRIASVRELQEAENTAVDSRLNAIVNRAVRDVFPEGILPAPLGETQLSAKNLRAAYTNIAYHLFGTAETSIGSFAEDFLGHQSAGSAANYEDYYCVDADGHPLSIGLLRDKLKAKAKRPKASKRTTVHVDGLLKERFEAFGEGTHKEKMAQLLDAAERNERLERQLHNAEQRLKVARD
ncbi:MAG: protelomerase family protein, partial [Phormidesmis sp.]